MTKIIFSVLFPLLQIYLVTVPLKVIDFFKNYFMSSSSFSEKGKPKFLRYLKLQIKIIKVPLMRCIFTNRTIGMTPFSIGTIGTNGPSV